VFEFEVLAGDLTGFIKSGAKSWLLAAMRKAACMNLREVDPKEMVKFDESDVMA
jgi:hypothetical protein